MKKAFIVLAFLALAACETKPLATIANDNSETTVEVVTRFNSITLYRVRLVDGNEIYIADRGPAEAGIQRTEFTVPSGTTTRPEYVMPILSERSAGESWKAFVRRRRMRLGPMRRVHGTSVTTMTVLRAALTSTSTTRGYARLSSAGAVSRDHHTAQEGEAMSEKLIKVPAVVFALGDREQNTQSGVTTVMRPLYYRGRRIGEIDPDYAEVVMRQLLKATR
jgi:hypothetical protein